MTTGSIIALAAVMALPAYASDSCNPTKLGGAYGFQLSGQTTISGAAQPVVSVGRVVFDDQFQGKGAVVSGYSSVSIGGFFLGNPVAGGDYEAHEDCTLTWSLQDDSGGFQHFSGKLSADSLSGEFHQSDAGGAQTGVLQKVAPNCSVAGLAPLYTFGISGSTTPMQPGEAARQVSVEGKLEPDAAGNLKITIPNAAPASGTITVDSDCFTQITMTLPSGDTIGLRGILVNGGKQILAMQTDPGAEVTAKFNAK